MKTTRKVSKCRFCGQEIEYEPVPHPFTAGKDFGFAPTICVTCEGSQKLAKKSDSQEMRKEKLAKQWEDLCPPTYRKTDPKRLPQRELAAVMSWAYGPRGLLLHGETGTCKTRTVWMLLKRLFWEGYTIKTFTSGEFFRASSDAWGQSCATEWTGRLVRADVLFIDDIGKSKMTDRNESDLFEIVEQRTSHERPIIITTNLVGAELEEAMSSDRGSPLVRRLREFCTSIAFLKQ